MDSAITGSTKKRIAVVTGANKGIGLETCRQLASNGVLVVLTARDKKRGIKAVESLKGSGLSNVIFHQLDVNNAGVVGVLIDCDALRAVRSRDGDPEAKLAKWKEVTTQTYELTEECVKANYYGVKQVTEALLPFLQISDLPRIVNVSSIFGKLKNISNNWAKGVLSNGDCLTEERVDEVLNQFLKDFKEGSVEAKGWPHILSANIVSKAALNAYTRILAKKFPRFHINCVCPGNVKTDINCNTGVLTVEEGAESVVRLALLPDDGPSGLFFIRSQVSLFD
ncbi:(+)-neomenthol dehydrogenase-like isoform X2 [Telopea speciosissima]|uniref:(+)-neomenthol dehydrogenase-like isoform X2 n=1 Tax=Telopea speciosissima TaxID=54955 RepID=UPI001CC58838|nr:(+)-neomenthol dehydrogenase-like isoform X2 [Telopea speciosissima]